MMSTQEHDVAPRPDRAPRLSPAAKARREWYLLRWLLWLDADTPGKDLAAAREQLRGDLDAAATETSMKQALRDLGPARLLAAEYRKTLRPSSKQLLWSNGVTAVCTWVVLNLLLAMVMVPALTQAAEQAGGEVHVRLLWATFDVVNTSQELSWGFGGLHWTLLVGLLLFLVFIRPWRLVPSLRPTRHD